MGKYMKLPLELIINDQKYLKFLHLFAEKKNYLNLLIDVRGIIYKRHESSFWHGREFSFFNSISTFLFQKHNFSL